MSLGSTSIFDDINNGYWDEGLDAIIEAAVARRKFIRQLQGARNKVNFVPGTRVRVINIRPNYLHGITGVVSTKAASRNGDLMVDIDTKCYHRLGSRFGKCLGIPASSLELI
jgi:hypothetical protein